MAILPPSACTASVTRRCWATSSSVVSEAPCSSGRASALGAMPCSSGRASALGAMPPVTMSPTPPFARSA